MRRLATLGLLTTLLLAGPTWGTSTKPGTPAPPPDIVDCSEDGNDICVECGGGLIACCYEDDCEVKNKPKPKAIWVPPSRPPVVTPQPGISWERAL